MPRESIEILSFNVSVCIVFMRVPPVIQPMACSAKPPSTKSQSADTYVRHSWVPFYHSQPPISHTSTPQPTSHVTLSHSSPKSHNHPLLSQTLTPRIPIKSRETTLSLTEEGARACVWLIVCLIMPMWTHVSVYVCAGECVRGWVYVCMCKCKVEIEIFSELELISMLLI